MKEKVILLLSLLGISFACCTKVALTDLPEKVSVTVRPDWGALPPAGGMKYSFYPVSGGSVIAEEGTCTEYKGALPSGGYRVLAYNTDASGITFTGMDSYATATAAIAPLPAGTTRAEGGTLVSQPSLLYAGTRGEELVVPLLDPVETSVRPRQLTRTLKLTFKLSDRAGVDNLEGFFNGVCPSVNLSTGEVSAATAPQTAVSFASAVTSETTAASVSFFGIENPQGGSAYRSTLRLTLQGSDGWRQETEVDLTNALTDLFAAGGEGFVFELPANIVINVLPTPTSLGAAVTGWTLGEGGAEIDYVYPKK